MSRRPTLSTLGSREREIMEIVYREKEVSVQEVLDQLAEPPSYSAVRTMMRYLENKGLLRHRRDGKKYLYRPVASVVQTSRSALKNVLETFFGGSPVDAMAAMIDLQGKQLSDEDFKRLETMIQNARHRKG